MVRASWKGYIRLSLVTVPVQAYTAHNTAEGDIRLNMLHESCHSRIRYVKTCPIHGEVPDDEIVRGYEYTKGQYAIIDPDEVQKLRTESDRAIRVDKFFPPALLDPMYFAGRTHYLIPDGSAGQRPYALLQRVMADEGLYCMGQVVLAGKEQVVVVRPMDRLLVMSALYYDAEVRKPETVASELGDVEIPKQELKLTKMLVEATTSAALGLAEYHDLYNERLRALIEAKIAGREVAQPPEEELPPVINLMDALRASVKQTQTEQASPRKKTPVRSQPAAKKKMATSAGKRKVAKKKRTG